MEEKTIRAQSIELVKLELTAYSSQQIDAVLTLLEEGNTVPFIARYRKDRTGSLDEVQIREIELRQSYLENLVKRKMEVSRLIEEQGKLTSDLKRQIQLAQTLTALEDIYLPYKQKKRTKATIAKEAGLQGLADWIFSLPTASIEEEAVKYIDEEHSILSAADAIHGALEIMIETMSDCAEWRKNIRMHTWKKGVLQTTVKKQELDEKGTYEMYYAYEEPVQKVVPHRILAMNRAEKEDVIRIHIHPAIQPVLDQIKQFYCKKRPSSPAVTWIEQAVEESYKRFIGPAIEREIRNELTEKAEQQAIVVFAENLKHLLLQPPMKDHVILGLDPAYRTGCKLAVIDETGKVLAKHVIYPHKGASEYKQQQAGKEFRRLIEQYNVSLVAIGNGTASRESEQFVSDELKLVNHPVAYTIVNEAGASVYSASEIARQEFPDFQVEERSAVSIARRLQDPLAELVKIDPKAVGVGQYQHDVSQKRLDEQLNFVVETTVNKVGINVNTASASLLEHIAGLNKTIAQNIVLYRNENGKFTSRMELKKVSRLGPKAFEQAVGFLRIPDGEIVLDNTDIHPESYDVAKQVLEIAGITQERLGTPEAVDKLSQLSIAQLANQLKTGKETIQLIMSSLKKPGRDVRDEVVGPILRKDVLSMEDLKEGMQLEGTVRNVVDFGAFIDIGVKQDGLVHISKLKQGFVKHPADVVSVGDIVTVWIESVDVSKQRIALTMIPM